MRCTCRHAHCAECCILLQVLETKGLDIVRRDWCPLARDVGRVALHEILTANRPADDAAEAIHELLRAVAAKVASGGVALEQFVLSKQLTKRPEEYPDAKAQAHVQVRACLCHHDVSDSHRCCCTDLPAHSGHFAHHVVLRCMSSPKKKNNNNFT